MIRPCDERVLRELARREGCEPWALVRYLLQVHAAKRGTTWRAVVRETLREGEGRPDGSGGDDRPGNRPRRVSAGHSGG